MKRLANILWELARCTSGSALVEMTLVVPIAVLLIGGVMDFGMALFMQATVAKSVHDAARYLGSLPASVGCPAWAQKNAKNLAVTGRLSGGSALVPGWRPSDITITCTSSAITVTTTVPYNSIIVTSLLPIATIMTLSAKHEERQVGS